MKSRALVVPAALAVAYVVVQAVPVQSPVQITHDAAAKTYAVSIGGKPFTAYAYGDAFVDKPIFYPVVSPNGARVHREFPMVTAVPGETSDHPHHQSLFFTYDEVNGIHFWNPDKTGRRIVHREARVQGNALVAMLDWKDKEGKVVLEETKRVTFGGGADLFWMDHDITLKAPNVPVIFGDSKEGAFGLRLNDTLKEAGGSGRYLNAEGLESGAVWGKPSAWVAIRGAVKDRGADTDVTVAMFAHPSGVNNPPYWHARDYGLFAVNPFGRKGYDPKAPERVTTLAVGQSLQVRVRVAVYAGKVEKARLDRDFATAAKAGR